MAVFRQPQRVYIAIMRLTFAFMIVLLTGCGQFPQLQDTISDSARAAPYPTLTPVPDLPAASTTIEGMAQVQADAAALRRLPAATSDRAELEARAAALRARAEEIRQIDIAALQ